jgi:hypothetical protein
MMRERERKTAHTQDRIEPMVELNIPAIYALFVLRSRRRKKDNEVFFSFREFLNNLRTRRATLFGENNNNLQKKFDGNEFSGYCQNFARYLIGIHL